jgi:hypothetical protein
LFDGTNIRQKTKQRKKIYLFFFFLLPPGFQRVAENPGLFFSLSAMPSAGKPAGNIWYVILAFILLLHKTSNRKVQEQNSYSALLLENIYQKKSPGEPGLFFNQGKDY